MLAIPPKFRLLFLILFFGHFCYAQNTSHIIDSLKQAFQNHTKEDSLKIDLLNEISYAYYTVDTRKGLDYANQAVALSLKTKNLKRQAASYSQKAIICNAMGDDSLAMQLYQKALSIHIQLNNRKSIATTLHNMGLIFFGQSQYRKALQKHQQAYFILQALKDSARMLNAQNSVGVNYMYLADYTNALQTFFNVVITAEKINNNTALASCYTNIGLIYKRTNQFYKALTYQTKAFKIYEAMENKEGMANCLGNIGIIYDEQNEHQKAIRYYTMAYKLANELGNKKAIASNTINIASSQQSLGNIDSALLYLKKAEVYYTELNDNNNLSSVFNQTAGILAKKGNHYKAIEMHKKALLLAEETKAIDRQSETWASLSNTYKLGGDYKNALLSFEKHVTLRDSIFNNEKAHQLGRSEADYENEKRTAILQATHTSQIKQQKIQRNFLTGGIGLIVLAGSGLFWFYKRRRDADQKVQNTETQMQIMRLQMNPHFIFNSLHSVIDYIQNNDTQKAENYLARFAKTMRMTLENSEQKSISLEEELKALEIYMNLEAERLNNKFTYEINVAQSIDQENTLVPPLIFQPFIENSIWHGITPKQEGGHITLHITVQNNLLYCIVDDNGIGRKSHIADKVQKKSMGMKITQARIDMLNRKNKKAGACIKFIDKEQGLRSELLLPFQLAF